MIISAKGRQSTTSNFVKVRSGGESSVSTVTTRAEIEPEKRFKVSLGQAFLAENTRSKFSCFLIHRMKGI